MSMTEKTECCYVMGVITGEPIFFTALLSVFFKAQNSFSSCKQTALFLGGGQGKANKFNNRLEKIKRL